MYRNKSLLGDLTIKVKSVGIVVYAHTHTCSYIIFFNFSLANEQFCLYFSPCTAENIEVVAVGWET